MTSSTGSLHAGDGVALPREAVSNWFFTDEYLSAE